MMTAFCRALLDRSKFGPQRCLAFVEGLSEDADGVVGWRSPCRAVRICWNHRMRRDYWLINALFPSGKEAQISYRAFETAVDPLAGDGVLREILEAARAWRRSCVADQVMRNWILLEKRLLGGRIGFELVGGR